MSRLQTSAEEKMQETEQKMKEKEQKMQEMEQKMKVTEMSHYSHLYYCSPACFAQGRGTR
jgi:hypothetical protein